MHAWGDFCHAVVHAACYDEHRLCDMSIAWAAALTRKFQLSQEWGQTPETWSQKYGAAFGQGLEGWPRNGKPRPYACKGVGCVQCNPIPPFCNTMFRFFIILNVIIKI